MTRATRSRSVFVLMILMLLLGVEVSAQLNQAKVKGFSPEHLYDYHGLDNVNSLNGNLVAVIPLGHSYTAGDRLQYSLRLVYNSDIWDMESRTPISFSNIDYINPSDPASSSDAVESVPRRLSNAGMGWQVTLGELTYAGEHAGSFNHTVIDMWRYVSSDGGEHSFYRGLHDSSTTPVPNDVVDASDDDVTYTRDGSYIRMHGFRTGGVITKRVIEMPDGVKQTFLCPGTTTAQCKSAAAGWQLTTIEDAFDNRVNVEHGTNDMLWTIYEGPSAAQALRKQVVTFRAVNNSPYTKIIDTIELSESRGRTARYQFNYAFQNIYTLPQCYPSPSAAVVPRNPSGGITVPLLQSVTLPPLDNAPAGSPAESWQFNYVVPNGAPATPTTNESGYFAENIGTTTPYWISWYTGRLERIVLPTGGGISYRWGGYMFPRNHCDGSDPRGPGSGPRLPNLNFSPTIGVWSRQQWTRLGVNDVITDANGNRVPQPPATALADGQAWQYFDMLNFPDDANPCTLPNTIQNMVVDPLGNATVRYYSVYMSGSDTTGQGWNRFEYGLPINRAENDCGKAGIVCGTGQPAPASARALSEVIYQCPVADFAYPLTYAQMKVNARAITTGLCKKPTDTTPDGRIRATYRRYEYSGIGCTGDFTGPDCLQTNRRLASELVYHYDPLDATKDTWETSDSSDFDGLNHYREIHADGNLAISTFGDGQDFHVSHTAYNVDRCPGAGSSRCSVDQYDLGLTNPWTLDIYNSKAEDDPLHPAVVTAFQFDANGFMTSQRIAHDPPTGANLEGVPACTSPCSDLTTTWNRTVSSTGVIRIDERHYGGDNAAAQNGGSEYRRVTTYQNGAVATVDWLKDDADLPDDTSTLTNSLLRETKLTIDAPSGVVIASVEPSQLETDFTYDLRGRVTGATQAGSLAAVEAPAQVQYAAVNGGTPASVFVWRGGPSSVSGTCADAGLACSEYQYDGLGRLIVERNQLPIDKLSGGGSFQERFTTYLPTGWMSTQTGFRRDNDTTSAFTKYDNYDPFGRAADVTLPDNKTIHFDYVGEHTRVKTVRQFASSGNQSIRTESFSYDRLHRLIKADDPPLTFGASDTPFTRYDYDSRSNLIKVWQGANLVQKRVFSYDGRGLMTHEQVPEYGPSGNGGVDYQYDSMGRLTKKLFPAVVVNGAAIPSTHSIEDRYDRAGRPTDAYEVESGDLLKHFEYFAAGDSCGSGFKVGKLHSSVRHNWVRDPYVTGTAAAAVKDFQVERDYDYAGVGGRPSNVTLLETDDSSPSSKTFSTSYAYDTLGNPTSITYPNCTGACGNVGVSRTASFTYQYGYLNGVTNYASLIHYGGTGLVSSVAHSNGVTDTYAVDANGIPRVASFNFKNGITTLLDSGPFTYDGDGNILKIGNDTYGLDPRGRVVNATISSVVESYSFDELGNMTGYCTGVSPCDTATGAGKTAFAIDKASNHITPVANSVVYDEAGNLTLYRDARLSTSVNRYWWDPLNLLNRMTSGTYAATFLYDADDERVAKLVHLPSVGGSNVIESLRETWSLRGTDHAVLRDFQNLRNYSTVPPETVPSWKNGWSWSEDYIYRGSSLLATVGYNAAGQIQTKHYSLDHLGSPRLVTDGANGSTIVARHTFFPFGEELLPPPGDTERKKFTGHERDYINPVDGAQVNNLDYMHARYYNAMLGRFLTTDPIVDLGASTQNPQMWNRYAYVAGRPLRALDPDGRAKEETSSPGKDFGEGVLKVTTIEDVPFVGIGTAFGAVGGFVGDVFTSPIRLFSKTVQDSLVNGVEASGAKMISKNSVIAKLLPLTSTVINAGVKAEKEISKPVTEPVKKATSAVRKAAKDAAVRAERNADRQIRVIYGAPPLM
jgi:RHS repeat-associated protein